MLVAITAHSVRSHFLRMVKEYLTRLGDTSSAFTIKLAGNSHRHCTGVLERLQRSQRGRSSQFADVFKSFIFYAEASPPESSVSKPAEFDVSVDTCIDIFSGSCTVSFTASLLLVQCLQYMEHWSVIRKETLSGYHESIPEPGSQHLRAAAVHIVSFGLCISAKVGTACILTRISRICRIHDKA